MTGRQLKNGYFALEGLNAFATTSYFYYLFFFLRDRFQFGDRENLWVSALHGFVYIFAALYGGEFAQKRGYFFALKVGFVSMLVLLTISSQLVTMAGIIILLVLWTVGMCFTWPTLEALIAEKESPANLQKLLGIYNMVWAAGSAAAYFVGGAMHEALGPQSMFWVPVCLHAVQLGLVIWLEKQSGLVVETPIVASVRVVESNPRPIGMARMFLKLAWLANPFAYIAISTVVPVIPTVAKKLQLSPVMAGVVCSLWFFARLAAFWGLWLWGGWHYRFRYFIGAFALLIACFTAILLAPTLAVIIVAQIGFGVALGLIYYSSLFYSMDVGDTKGEHGGFHEAAIGIGICAGPTIGATSLYFFPDKANSGTWAVSGLLVMGLVASLVLWIRSGVRGKAG